MPNSVCHPDCGRTVERPNAPEWLRPQRGARWRVLLGSGCHRGGAGQARTAAPHPLARVQTGGLRVLPQPHGMPDTGPFQGSHRAAGFYILFVCLMFSGTDHIFSLQLLRGGQQQRRLHQDGPRPGAALCSVSSQQDEPRAHAEAKVHKGPRGEAKGSGRARRELQPGFLTKTFPVISISWTERSALQALREQLFAHRSDLIAAFREFDLKDTGITSDL